MFKNLMSLGLSIVLSTSALFGMADVTTMNDLFSSDSAEVEYDRPLIVHPEKFGSLGFFYFDGTYYVEHEGKLHEVHNAFVDKKLRGMTQEQLLKFWDSGYIAVNQYKDSDDFYLTAKTRGLGGGPFFANLVYWGTKALIYGGVAVAAGTGVVATGGLLLGPITAGGVAGGTTAVAAATVGTMVTGATGVGGATAATAVATFIGGAGFTTAATTATIAGVTAAGGVGTAVIATEMGAGGLAAIAMMLPTP